MLVALDALEPSPKTGMLPPSVLLARSRRVIAGVLPRAGMSMPPCSRAACGLLAKASKNSLRPWDDAACSCAISTNVAGNGASANTAWRMLELHSVSVKFSQRAMIARACASLVACSSLPEMMERNLPESNVRHSAATAISLTHTLIVANTKSDKLSA